MLLLCFSNDYSNGGFFWCVDERLWAEEPAAGMFKNLKTISSLDQHQLREKEDKIW